MLGGGPIAGTQFDQLFPPEIMESESSGQERGSGESEQDHLHDQGRVDLATLVRMVNSCAYYIAGETLLAEHRKCTYDYTQAGWGGADVWKRCGPVVPERPRYLSKHFVSLRDQITH